MSKDNYAIKPEGDIDKAREMGKPDGVFNQPFQPMAGLPTKEVAEQVEQARIAINAKDTIRLEKGTLLAFAAAQWVTKTEFQAVMSHIRILEQENTDLRFQFRLAENRYADMTEKWQRAMGQLHAVKTKVGTIKHFFNQLFYGKGYTL